MRKVTYIVFRYDRIEAYQDSSHWMLPWKVLRKETGKASTYVGEFVTEKEARNHVKQLKAS